MRIEREGCGRKAWYMKLDETVERKCVVNRLSAWCVELDGTVTRDFIVGIGCVKLDNNTERLLDVKVLNENVAMGWILGDAMLYIYIEEWWGVT